MNRELCIATLFTVLVIASAMHPLEAAARHHHSPTPSPTPTPIPTTPVFNCPSFAAGGSCGVSLIGSGGEPFGIDGGQNGSSPGFSGSQVDLIPANAVHTGLNLNWRVSAVNVQAFSTTFTYVPNGWNIAFILSNNTNSGAANIATIGFAAGAGCEGSFFQGFNGSTPPNNTFALELDQYSSLTAGGSTFTYSSVQYYDTGHSPPNAPNGPGQSPCNPNLGGSNFTYVGVNKISTSPVPLNNPPGTVNTTTGDTYSVTITYDGSNLTISLYDVTAGGSCPGASCFTNTWTNVNIPSIVGANTAYVGLGGGTNGGLPHPLLINTWSYGAVSPTQ
jgi:hypothetical protein